MTEPIHRIGDLAKLESFDPVAFEANGIVSQDICNFFLTLALIFNDLKDILHASTVIQSVKPTGDFKITRHYGAYAGIYHHFLRLLVSLVHEVVAFVKDNEKIIKTPFFQSVLMQLSKEDRASWQAMLKAAEGKQADTPLGRFVLIVRNKIAFHYDPKDIHSGYQEFFSSKCKGSEHAFISRGKNIAETRFFFADAAVTGCLTKNVQGHAGDELIADAISILCDLNHALMDLVNNFILKRGHAYLEAKEEE